MAEPSPYHEVMLTRKVDGSIHVEGEIPTDVWWSFEALEMMRAGGSRWASIDAADVVTMDVEGGSIRYRLTGERDVGGGFISERIDESGARWPEHREGR